MIKNYFCNLCEQTFSRRWSAERHNDNIHQGTAIIKSLSELIFDSTKSGSALNKDNNRANIEYFSNLEKSEDVNLRMIIENAYFGREYVTLQYHSTPSNIKMAKMLHKLGSNYRKAEQTLSEISNEYRWRILGYMVLKSLQSADPPKTMIELVKSCQNTTAICNMIRSVSMFTNENPILTKEYLQRLMDLKR